MKRWVAMVSLCLMLTAGCAKEQAAPDQASEPFSAATVEVGDQLTLSPDPVPICDGSGLGQASVSWSVSQRTLYRVFVGTHPDGKLFAEGRGSGTAQTGKWVKEGSTFYLTRGDDPSVIATVTARTTTEGCP